MAKVYVPYELPTAGGAGYRPATIPEAPGFGGPPTEYPAPGLASSPLATLPDWFRYDPQVLVTKDGLVLGTSAEIIGTPTPEAAENVTMKSDKTAINGFVVKDDCTYTIRDTTIDFQGDGVDDFSGYGAGVQAAGESTVVLENTKITTEGVIRPCTSATEYSTLIVRNCELDSKGGVIDRSAANEPGAGKAMKEPPAGLGLGGNCRTHLSVGDSHSYFYDSKIYAEGWAALSTDACFGDLYLEANRCDIQVRDNGYASYCDHGANVVLNDCNLKATIGVIIAGKCREFLNRCTVKAGDYAAMLHSVFGNTHEVSELSVQGGDIKSGKECFLIKSQNVYLDIRGAKLHSDTGVLIRTKFNEDPCRTELPDFEEVYGVKAVLSDMDIEGDILHEDPQRVMALTLKHTKLKGRIENAVIVTDPSTIWTATADSHVTVTAFGPMGKIDALPDVTIYAKSDVLKPSTTDLPSGGKLVVEGQAGFPGLSF
ncbi:MAG: hypothetical protein IJ206_04800 [Oscillospiraceae bacterium]|nr:hypothetical protein [Oscillospiraceae bacterium]